jgi:hypothetical protein
MATKKQDDGKSKARVLVAGMFGKTDDVVELDKAAIDAGVAIGELDDHPEAVAYAESLKG